jgi:hypothetical protein
LALDAKSNERAGAENKDKVLPLTAGEATSVTGRGLAGVMGEESESAKNVDGDKDKDKVMLLVSGGIQELVGSESDGQGLAGVEGEETEVGASCDSQKINEFSKADLEVIYEAKKAGKVTAQLPGGRLCRLLKNIEIDEELPEELCTKLYYVENSSDVRKLLLALPAYDGLVLYALEDHMLDSVTKSKSLTEAKNYLNTTFWLNADAFCFRHREKIQAVLSESKKSKLRTITGNFFKDKEDAPRRDDRECRDFLQVLQKLSSDQKENTHVLAGAVQVLTETVNRSSQVQEQSMQSLNETVKQSSQDQAKNTQVLGKAIEGMTAAFTATSESTTQRLEDIQQGLHRLLSTPRSEGRPARAQDRSTLAMRRITGAPTTARRGQPTTSNPPLVSHCKPCALQFVDDSYPPGGFPLTTKGKECKNCVRKWLEKKQFCSTHPTGNNVSLPTESAE